MVWLTLLWSNKRIIAEIISLILAILIGYWFFIHNPNVIDGLEKDKVELSRQLEAGKRAITLLSNIQKSKEVINDATFKNISTIKSNAIPRRAVIIKYGLL